MADNLRILAKMISKPECADELCELLKGLVAPTHKEEGCVRYEMWRNRENPLEFTFVEEWTSEALLEKHLRSDHLVHCITRLDDLLAEPLQLGKYDGVA